jgi:hypothetical protein
MAGGPAQLIFKPLRHVSSPFAFDFVSEERASEIIKTKYSYLFQCGAEASSSLRRNKWSDSAYSDAFDFPPNSQSGLDSMRFDLRFVWL